jgi:hypothetical protein
MSEIHQIVASVHTHTEVLALPDGRREAEVLYLGSAIGYYVSADEQRAGLRVKTPDGWQIQPRPEIAAAVKHALEVARQERPPGLVRLPVVVPQVEASQ